jgi:hypothetical protein
VGFEPTISVLELVKTVHALDRAATVIGRLCNRTPWPQSACELYRQSDRRLSAKLVPTFADGVSQGVSVTGPYGRILCFLDRRLGNIHE